MQQAARPTSTLTADQCRLLTTLKGLEEEDNWQGVVNLERELLALATTVRGAIAAAVHCMLGRAFQVLGKYARAREMHEKHKAICEALGDRAGVAKAWCNLGNCYHSTGDYVRAREMHEQAMTICEALGDRAGVARACGNLGNCYQSTGDYARARELHEQRRAMAEALGDRAGVATACGNLGNCYYSTGRDPQLNRSHLL